MASGEMFLAGDSAILPAHEAKCVIMIEHIARLTVPIRRFDINI